MNKEKVLLVVNEKQELLENQVKALRREFPVGWERLEIPAEGWTTFQQWSLLANTEGDIRDTAFVFASREPIPAMVIMAKDFGFRVHALVNNQRIEEELTLEDGTVLTVYSYLPDGWEVF